MGTIIHSTPGTYLKNRKRKFNIEDDQDNHIKNLQKRIDTLEDDTEKMKSKFEKITECYLNLRKALIDHLQTLKDNSDTAEVKSQMERLRELLDLICNDMLLNLPGDSAEAESQLKLIQNLCGKLQNHKDDVIKEGFQTDVSYMALSANQIPTPKALANQRALFN